MLNYKKLVSVFAVSAIALGACGTDTDKEEPQTDDVEESSSKDQIKQAKDSSGTAFPEYGLEVTGANWTVDGYEVPYVAGEEATASADIKSDQGEYYVYFVEDNKIIDVKANEPEVAFTLEDPAEDSDYLIGVVGEDLGNTGTEVSEDDFYRYEKVIFVETEEADEE